MRMSLLVIDFIIFTAAAVVGFIFGAFWVDSEFERDSAYLAAEVESLNDALDVLEEQHQELSDLYDKKLEEEKKTHIALQRAIDGIADRDKVIRSLNAKIEDMTWTDEKVERAIRDAWDRSQRDDR